MRLQSIGGRIAMPEVSQDVQQPFRSAQPTTPMPQDDLAGALLAAQQHAQVPANSFQSAFLGPVAEFYHNKRQNALDEKAVMAQQQASQAQSMQQADAVYKAFRQAGADDNTARAYAGAVMAGKLDPNKAFEELTKDKSFTLGAGAERRAADGSLIAANERDAATTRIEMDGGPKFGTIPQGYMLTRDEDGNYRQVPVPGGPAEREIAEGEEADADRAASRARQSDSVIEEIDYALGMVGPTTSGIGGAVARTIPGTKAVDLEAALQSVRGNLAFDRLQQMREQSPTGGALGQVSNIELNLLESTVAGYNPNMSDEAKRRYLEKIKTHYTNWKTAAVDGQLPEQYRDQGEDGEAQGDVERRETRNGKTYVLINGEWYEEGN